MVMNNITRNQIDNDSNNHKLMKLTQITWIVTLLSLLIIHNHHGGNTIISIINNN